jgi:hypothetical protein
MPSIPFGDGSDIPVPGDYDKDGYTDIAVFRPSEGRWYILKSSTDFATWMPSIPFGGLSDFPLK